MAGSFLVYGDLPGFVFWGEAGVPPDYSFTNLNTFNGPFLQTPNGQGTLFDDSPEAPGAGGGGDNTVIPGVELQLFLPQTSLGSTTSNLQTGDLQMTSNQSISLDETGGPASAVPEPQPGFLIGGAIVLALLAVRLGLPVGNTS